MLHPTMPYESVEEESETTEQEEHVQRSPGRSPGKRFANRIEEKYRNMKAAAAAEGKHKASVKKLPI